jgi:hypothetical protein
MYEELLGRVPGERELRPLRALLDALDHHALAAEACADVRTWNPFDRLRERVARTRDVEATIAGPVGVRDPARRHDGGQRLRQAAAAT